ncbi:hypothetical protein Smp_122230 [Schistosoma mansoni]|uniref:hypothetical protein n=1 Tax=Schistosoma mansoni TaxID=6183 RepID=UPI0001A61A4D|nr:hypothetical protein Smp_122230 [Schistosoma mansoni]|eukprot:XP_018645357.1 hypothetical protein Smp_122230 [Schistosoma mansoni]
MNKLIGTQHQSYSPVSRVKGSFDKSPPPRLLHTNITNMSPYENMKYFNNSENSFNEDGQFYSPPKENTVGFRNDVIRSCFNSVA